RGGRGRGGGEFMPGGVFAMLGGSAGHLGRKVELPGRTGGQRENWLAGGRGGAATRADPVTRGWAPAGAAGKRAAIAQSAEHFHGKEGVISSNLIGGSIFSLGIEGCRALSPGDNHLNAKRTVTDDDCGRTLETSGFRGGAAPCPPAGLGRGGAGEFSSGRRDW